MYFKIEQRICGGKRPAAAEDTFNQWFLKAAPHNCVAQTAQKIFRQIDQKAQAILFRGPRRNPAKRFRRGEDEQRNE